MGRSHPPIRHQTRLELHASAGTPRLARPRAAVTFGRGDLLHQFDNGRRRACTSGSTVNDRVGMSTLHRRRHHRYAGARRNQIQVGHHALDFAHDVRAQSPSRAQREQLRKESRRPGNSCHGTRAIFSTKAESRRTDFLLMRMRVYRTARWLPAAAALVPAMRPNTEPLVRPVPPG